MPSKKQPDSDRNKVPGELLRGYNERRQNDVVQNYVASGYILTHLNEVISKILEQSQKETDKIEPSEVQDFQNQIARDIGYRQALRKILNLLPNDVEIKDED